MISTSRHLPLVLAAAVASAACAGSAAAPTAGALLALDKQAHEAYIKGDGKFFESLLSDKLVMRADGARLSKTDAVRMISAVKCEVREGWSLTQPQMLRIDHDTYVLSYKTTREGSCTADGKTAKLPSPVRAATVWVRSGDEWQAVFRGENLIVDPAAPQATDKQEEPKQAGKAAANANVAGAPAPAIPTADPSTSALMAAERSIWEAWRTHDARKIEDLTAEEIAFVNIFGTSFANKVATMKDWTSTACDVTSFTLTDGVGTSVSATVGILTLVGSVDGACGGQDISGLRIYGTSVYVKKGDAWKWVFGFNSPS